MMFPMQNVNGHVKGAYADASQTAAGAVSIITAAATEDGVKTTGATIDRQGYESIALVIAGLATLTAAKTMSLAAELQESDDGSTWATAEALYTTTVVATGAGNKSFLKQTAVNCAGRKRYIRFNVTPDLSHTSTDTAEYVAVAVLGGAQVLPAA